MAMTNEAAPYSYYHTVRRGSQFKTGTVQMAPGEDIQQFEDFINDPDINGHVTEQMCISIGIKLAIEDTGSTNAAIDAVLQSSNTKNVFVTVEVAEGAGSSLDGRNIQLQLRGAHEAVSNTTVIAALTAFDSSLSSSNVTVKSLNIKSHSAS